MEETEKWQPILNSVTLLEAVLCADCEIISNSGGETCEVCGSRSLFNIARMFGGSLPQNRAALVPSETLEVRHEVVLSFPSHDRLHLKAGG